ncbi:MAG: DegT/DnrJ/EryC1/StrS family aminotransferase, partial [Flammeovirgaceae bacterium]
DIEALTQVLKKYEGLHHGHLVTDFEKEIQALTGSPFVLALNSGTSAIHLGLLALGVQPNDSVFVSTFTFIGSLNPILYVGANPVFIDSEEQTWNMDPILLERALSEHQKAGKLPAAIIVVHTYGMPAKMDEISAVANQFGVPVLEDAAEAIGSYYKGIHAGALAQAGVLSFNSNKTITTFGGGALLTKSKILYDKAKALATHSSANKTPAVTPVGYNYKLGPLSAAMGLASLEKLDKKLASKREIFNYYKQCFGKIADIRMQNEPPGHSSNYWLSCIVAPKPTSQIALQLGQIAAETRPAWKPLHMHSHLSHFKQYNNKVAEELHTNGICLPSTEQLSESELESIATTVVNCL